MLRPMFMGLLLAAGVLAQEPVGEDPSGKKRSSARVVRFLAVGDTPPFRQEIRNGVRYELEPPAGSIPPRELMLAVPGNGGGEDALPGTVRLRLGSMSGPVEVPAGGGSLTLMSSDADDRDAWLKFERPEDGDFVVILWRDPQGGSWEKARSLVVPTGQQAGRVVLANVSPAPLAVVFGEERLALPPGRTVVRNLPPGKPLAFQLGMQLEAGGMKRISSTSLEQQAGERSLVVLYRSDGIKPRQPIGMQIIRENAAPVAKP